jgi:protein CpxP
MMTLTTRIALSLATFGFASFLGMSPAHAARPDGDRKADKAERLCAKLACSDAQKTQIKAIKDAKAPQMKAGRDNLRKLHEQVRAELRKPSPDAKAIERLDAEMAAQKAALHKQRRASQLQILALLKPDQKARLLDQMDKKGQGHGRGKGHGKGGRRGLGR